MAWFWHLHDGMCWQVLGIFYHWLTCTANYTYPSMIIQSSVWQLKSSDIMFTYCFLSCVIGHTLLAFVLRVIFRKPSNHCWKKSIKLWRACKYYAKEKANMNSLLTSFILKTVIHNFTHSSFENRLRSSKLIQTRKAHSQYTNPERSMTNAHIQILEKIGSTPIISLERQNILILSICEQQCKVWTQSQITRKSELAEKKTSSCLNSWNCCDVIKTGVTG